MTNNDRVLNGRADNWERFGWAWIALGFVAPLVATLLALSNVDLTAEVRTTAAWLAFGYLLWYALLVVIMLRVDGYQSKPAIGITYFAVAITLWYMLVDISPAFYLILFALFGQIFNVLRLRPAILVMIVLSAAMAYSQVDELPLRSIWQSSALWITVLTAVSGILLGLWIHSIIVQSAERRHLIEQLQQMQVELATSERNAGMLEERQRLARDIHDTLAQGFTSIVMQLEAAEQALNGEPTGATQRAHAHVDRARQIARRSLDEARRVINDLRPESLEQASLPQALARQVATWNGNGRERAELTISGDPLPLHPEIEVTLLRVLQEALANVRKHAQANSVNVTLTFFGDSVALDVQDDGIGLAAANGQLTSFPGGYGLQAMSERIERLGGTLLIESEAAEGTTLAAEIPLAMTLRPATQGHHNE